MRFSFCQSLLLASLFLISCTESKKEQAGNNVVTFNNFDSMDGWGTPVATVTNEKAHSGKYSAKVDAETEYSFGFTKLLGELAPEKPKKLKLEAWTYVSVKEAGAAKLVLSITRPATGESVAWHGVNLNEVGKTGKWNHVKTEMKLPEHIEIGDRLQFYLWASGISQPVYMDDVKISVVE